MNDDSTTDDIAANESNPPPNSMDEENFRQGIAHEVCAYLTLRKQTSNTIVRKLNERARIVGPMGLTWDSRGHQNGRISFFTY